MGFIQKTLEGTSLIGNTAHLMIFSRKNAGKWVASKNGKVVESSKKLETLLKKVEKREDRKSIWFDRVPDNLNFAGGGYAV